MEAEETSCLSTWTICWMVASLAGGSPRRQKSAFILPAGVRAGLDMQVGSVACGKEMFERHQVTPTSRAAVLPRLYGSVTVLVTVLCWDRLPMLHCRTRPSLSVFSFFFSFSFVMTFLGLNLDTVKLTHSKCPVIC